MIQIRGRPSKRHIKCVWLGGSLIFLRNTLIHTTDFMCAYLLCMFVCANLLLHSLLYFRTRILSLIRKLYMCINCWENTVDSSTRIINLTTVYVQFFEVRNFRGWTIFRIFAILFSRIALHSEKFAVLITRIACPQSVPLHSYFKY